MVEKEKEGENLVEMTHSVYGTASQMTLSSFKTRKSRLTRNQAEVTPAAGESATPRPTPGGG